METVGLCQKHKRAGGGGSLVRVGRNRRSLRSLGAEHFFEKRQVRADGFPPLPGTHMMVCSNRWLRGSFVLITGRAFFLIRQRQKLVRQSIRNCD